MGGWDIWSMMTGISLLVGGFNPSENMKVNWDHYSILFPYIMKIKAMFQTNNQYIMWNYVIFFIL